MGLFTNWLGSQIFGSNSPQEYAQPIGPGLLGSPDYSADGSYPGAQRPNFGVLSPQVPSFDQYNQDRHSFSGIMGALSGGRPGLFSALGQAFAPDSFSVPGYNALLGQGQGIEANRLQFPQKQFMSDLLSNKIDPETGQRLAAGESQLGALPTPYAPRIPGMGAQPAQSPPDIGGMAFGGGGQGLLNPTFAPGNATAPQAQPAPPPEATGAAPPAGDAAPPQVHRFLGVPTAGNMTPYQAMIASIGNPEGYKEFNTAYFAPNRADSYGIGDDGRKRFFPGGEKGIPVPPTDPRYPALMAEQLRTQKGIEQGVRTRAEQTMALFNRGLKYGTGAVTGGDGATPDLPGGNTTAPPPAPNAQTTTPPPANAVSSSPKVAAFQRKDYVDPDKGTVIPTTANGNQNLDVNKLGTEGIDGKLKNSDVTLGKWQNNEDNLQVARDRLELSANIFSQMEGKGLNEAREEAASKLRGAGLDWLADQVMSKQDMAGVQTIVWNSMQEAMSQLKDASAGTGSKILATEFNAYMAHGFSPDMLGDTLKNAVGHQLGKIYQGQNLMEGWAKAQQMGWQDFNQYKTAFYKANPIDGFVNYSMNALPKFKGETAAAARATRPPALEELLAEQKRRQQQ